jgi:hypothetical protein
MCLQNNWLAFIKNQIFSKCIQRFIDFLQRFFFENFKIFLNNIIGVKMTKVLKYDNPSKTLHYNNPWKEEKNH